MPPNRFTIFREQLERWLFSLDCAAEAVRREYGGEHAANLAEVAKVLRNLRGGQAYELLSGPGGIRPEGGEDVNADL